MSDCRLTHNELASNLARHLMHESRMVWEDIPAGPSGSVRPDVYTIEKSFSNPRPVSYEIKVSVADFRSDITSAKWKSYLDFSYGVVFAVPKGLITKKDLPNGCGLMTFNGEFWNTVKRPTLHPAPLNDDLLLKLLISGNERQTKSFQPVPREYDDFKHYDQLRKRFGEDIREKIHFIRDYPDMVKELTAMRQRLANLFDMELDKEPRDQWRFDRHLEYKIQQLEVMANESTRKAAIAKELEDLSRGVNYRLKNIIENYTS